MQKYARYQMISRNIKNLENQNAAGYILEGL